MDGLAKSLMEMPLELVPGPPADIDPPEPNIDPLDLDLPYLDSPYLDPSVPSLPVRPVTP